LWNVRQLTRWNVSANLFLSVSGSVCLVSFFVGCFVVFVCFGGQKLWQSELGFYYIFVRQFLFFPLAFFSIRIDLLWVRLALSSTENSTWSWKESACVIYLKVKKCVYMLLQHSKQMENSACVSVCVFLIEFFSMCVPEREGKKRE
jgi:hypothetical protein